MAETTDTTEKNLPTLVSELWDLVVRYAKQETLDPLSSLFRYVRWGLAGTVLLAIGIPLLLLGGLRAAQMELSPHLDGNLSWVPYAMVVGASGLLAGLLVRAIFVDKRRADRERAALARREGS